MVLDSHRRCSGHPTHFQACLSPDRRWWRTRATVVVTSKMGALSNIRLLFPVALLLAATLRSGLFSLGYLVLFLTHFFIRPIKRLPFSFKWHISLVYYVVSLVWGLIALFAQILFHILMATGSYEPTSTSELFGLTDLGTWYRVMQSFAIDSIVSIALVVIISTLRKLKTPPKAAPKGMPSHRYMRVLHWSTAISLLLAGISNPGLLSLPYFIIFAIYFPLKVFGVNPKREPGVSHIWGK